MGAVTPETCRVLLQWINICILLHLLDFYSHWITMHGTTSLKKMWKDILLRIYKVVQIWPGLVRLVYTQISPGHIWTILYPLRSVKTILQDGQPSHGGSITGRGKIDFSFLQNALRPKPATYWWIPEAPSLVQSDQAYCSTITPL